MSIMASSPSDHTRILTPSDHASSRSLLRSAHYLHRHLDWLKEKDCFIAGPTLGAYQHQELTAVLACPPEGPGTAWIRLLAARRHVPLSSTFKQLWQAAVPLLTDSGIHTAAVMALAEWIVPVLADAGFSVLDNVIFYEQDLPALLPHKIHDRIRTFHPEDLSSIQVLDQLAFSSVWRHAPESLEAAVQKGSYITVYESDSCILGYQISTQSAFGAHLARLAVLPEAQNQGIGHLLVSDLLDYCSRIGMFRITVNTQEENIASQHLYEKLGFSRMNLHYPVCVYPLNDSESFSGIPGSE
jgi:ribosomal protein S18 acetylase RimI-like enzyme